MNKTKIVIKHIVPISDKKTSEKQSEAPLQNFSFTVEIRRICKQIRPTAHIHKDTVEEINKLLYVVFKQIMSNLSTKESITVEDICTNIESRIRGYLSEYAISSGNIALSKFSTVSAGDVGFNMRPSKIHATMLNKFGYKLDEQCVIFLAGALEYIMEEILDFSGWIAEHKDICHINTLHLRTAITQDEEFRELFKDTLLVA